MIRNMSTIIIGPLSLPTTHPQRWRSHGRWRKHGQVSRDTVHIDHMCQPSRGNQLRDTGCGGFDSRIYDENCKEHSMAVAAHGYLSRSTIEIRDANCNSYRTCIYGPGRPAGGGNVRPEPSLKPGTACTASGGRERMELIHYFSLVHYSNKVHAC